MQLLPSKTRKEEGQSISFFNKPENHVLETIYEQFLNIFTFKVFLTY